MITFVDQVNSNTESPTKKKVNNIENTSNDITQQVMKNDTKKKINKNHIIVDEKKSYEIFKELNLSGLQLDLAENSLLLIQNNEQKLIIDEKKKNIYPSSCISDFIQHLSNILNSKIDPEISYVSGINTISSMEQQKIQSNKDSQYDNIKDNPEIKKIKEMFNAQIDKDKIKQIKK
tara:strand:+ start:9 stop:536 length:528 start_codon:yes stop_codon:yes gene_type:complete